MVIASIVWAQHSLKRRNNQNKLYSSLKAFGLDLLLVIFLLVIFLLVIDKHKMWNVPQWLYKYSRK